MKYSPLKGLSKPLMCFASSYLVSGVVFCTFYILDHFVIKAGWQAGRGPVSLWLTACILAKWRDGGGDGVVADCLLAPPAAPQLTGSYGLSTRRI